MSKELVAGLAVQPTGGTGRAELSFRCMSLGRLVLLLVPLELLVLLMREACMG